jgi:pyruvate carboxylase subunit B
MCLRSICYVKLHRTLLKWAVNNLTSLNKWLQKQGKAEVTQDEVLIKLFSEVEYVRPQFGYPPLVTPYSQYVKNVALMNVLNAYKGKPRWSLIDENTWDMLLGRAGSLPGKLGDEILALAKAQGREFYNGHPQELYPDDLEMYRQKMKEKSWETGEDDEELLEYAMHPKEYESYKSGEAKKKFLVDLEAEKAKTTSSLPTSPSSLTNIGNLQPKKMNITVNGERFVVNVAYGDEAETVTDTIVKKKEEAPEPIISDEIKEIFAPLEGKFYLTKDSSEKPIQIGDKIIVGQVIAYIEAMKVINAISSDKAGTVVEICYKDGQDVEEDEVIVKLQ